MAQNTMNTNSQDVVKSVESKNVESTSNEQRQTVKPIVISRRRLLRAGVAGIPVVLTMAGVAPGQFGGGISAASGLNYDKKNTLGRFTRIHDDVLRDNLIYSDNDGFIFKREGGYYDVSCKNTDVEPTSTGSGLTATITLLGLSNDAQSGHTAVRPPEDSDISFTLRFNEGAITYPARLNKNGDYYTQQTWFTIDKEKIDAALSSLSFPEAYDIADIVSDNETITIGTLDTTDWAVAPNPWRVVPSESKQVTVSYSAHTTFSYKTVAQEDTSVEITYTGTVKVELTFPATVSTPELTFGKQEW